MGKLIVGCGYVGRRLAEYWCDQGEEVWATTRSRARAKSFQESRIQPLVMDVTQAQDIVLPAVETVVFSVGFDRSSEHTIQEVYVDGLKCVVELLPDSVRQFIYLSSTGVYGQTDGAWVDEAAACEPFREGGKACLAAEELLRNHEKTRALFTILRLAGIYGPGRLPQMDKLKQAVPLQVAADGFLNLIHVDDIVRIVAKADSENLCPTTLCVSDGKPVVREEFYACLARLLQTAAPQFQPPDPSSTRAARARGSKRIRNQRLMETIGLDLRYPDYEAGLKAIVEQLS